MLAEPDRLYGQGIGSNYQNQTETLGKHFRLDAVASLPHQPRHRREAGEG
jgi:hypothetical protein